MRPCSDIADLLRAPVGRWFALGESLVWCHSPTLCGMAVWGRPGVETTRALLGIMDGYRVLAPQFDVVQDASAVEALDPDALALLIEWMPRRRELFGERIGHRMVVLPPGLSGFALAGLGPTLVDGSPVEICASAREALVRLLPDGGAALADEVEALVAGARSVPPLITSLRQLLADARGAIDVATAARNLGISPRSLQRQLGAVGLSFRGEQADARWAAAEALLAGDDKIAAIASRLGLSEDGLTELCRARTGATPGELRKRLRS